MAAISTNIAEELYAILVNDPYEIDVKIIEADSEPRPDELKNVRKLIDKNYRLDMGRFQSRRGNHLPNGMFELFGEYSGSDAQTVRDELCDWLQDKNNKAREVVTNAMNPYPHRSLTGWLMTMRNAKYAADELTLYALCRLYHRHALVYTMTGLWTTIKDGVLLGEAELIGKCDIILLHLGSYRYGELKRIETAKKRAKTSTAESLLDELIMIRENNEKSHNTRPRKKLNYKDLSEGRSPNRRARRQPYKPLPGLGPSEIRMSAQESIDEIRRSRIVGSVTIKEEDEKPKIKTEKGSISSNTATLKRKDTGHCPKHCTLGKKHQRTETTETLPDLPIKHTIELDSNKQKTDKVHEETAPRSVVTDTETNLVEPPKGIMPALESEDVSRITLALSITPAPIPIPDDATASIERPNQDTRSVVTSKTDPTKTGETTVAKKLSDDYSVPEEIASEALAMLRDMSQPNTQGDDDDDEDDEYALPVEAARLPDLVSEMNEERGIKMVIDYDAEIPEDMKLKQTTDTAENEKVQEKQREPEKDNESDETIIYDVNKFEGVTHEAPILSEPQNEEHIEREKSLKGQLRTQTYGIIKRKTTRKRTYTCIECGTKCTSKQEINDHYRNDHSSIKCPDCDRVFPMPDALQRHRYVHTDRDKFICDRCGKDYPFESDLNRHKIKHRNKEIKTHVCMAAGCERSFMRKADLISHAENHTGTIHKCDQCDYSATDIRYLKQHQRRHSDELRIKCKICHRGFRYYTQMKRHVDRDH